MSETASIWSLFISSFLAATNPATQACGKIAPLRYPGTTAGMGAAARRCAMPRCRLAAPQSVAGRTVHGDRKIRALLGDCAGHCLTVAEFRAGGCTYTVHNMRTFITR